MPTTGPKLLDLPIVAIEGTRFSMQKSVSRAFHELASFEWYWCLIVLATLQVGGLSKAAYAESASKDIRGERSLKSISIESGLRDYKLGPREKIRVMVHEWRPSIDEIHVWEALNGEYTVGPSGHVALPLVGQIYVEDKSVVELAEVLSAQLMRRMGMARPPHTSIEIVEYRPIYVFGDVGTPGEYAYRPGLKVLQAISLAGGLFRGKQLGPMRLERDVVNSHGEINRLKHEKRALLVRRARLEAEFNKKDHVNCPPEFEVDGKLACEAQLLKQERQIFKARRTLFDTQMQSLKNLKNYLEQETGQIDLQVMAHEKQLVSLRTELAAITRLTAKGLVTMSRRLGLERNLAQLEGTGLQLNRDKMRVKQEISRAEIAIVDIEDKRSGEIMDELQKVEIRLVEIDLQVQTARLLLQEAVMIAPGLFRQQLADQQSKPTYTIVRTVDEKIIELQADEINTMQAGDTLKVQLIRPAATNDRFDGSNEMSPSEGRTSSKSSSMSF